MFTFAVSCWPISNLPWFMDLTFQVPINIALCIGSCFHHESHPQLGVVFASYLLFCISSFFLELFLHWSPVAYWAPTSLGTSSFSVISVCLFILLMGFLRQKYWSGEAVPSPMDHILSELSNMSHPSWVALQGMTHSFIELDKAAIHVTRLVSFLWLWFSACPQSVCPQMEKDKRLWKLPDGRDWLRGKRSCSDGRGHAQ